MANSYYIPSALGGPQADLTRVANAIAYGAKGDGVNDDTVALNSAATAAAAMSGNGGTVYLPPGTYYVTSTVTFSSHVSASQALITTDQDITCVQLGDGTNYFRNKVLYLPNVQNTAKVGLGWSGSSVGVSVVNSLENEIHVGQIRGFVTGLFLTSNGSKGNVYNNYFLGTFWDNQTQLKITPSAVTSWVNENNLFGGRFLYNTAELQAPSTSLLGQAGTRDIYIKMYPSDSGHIPNNNVFYKPDLEGDVPQYHIECQGNSNYFNHCRWEASYPKVYFSSYSSAKASKSNQVSYGYNSEHIVVTEDSNANYNTVHTNGSHWINPTSAGTTGVMVMQNASSSADPIFVGLKAQAAGASFVTDPTTDYTFSISANTSLYKNSTDAYPRLEFDHLNGRIYAGLGLASLTSYLASSNGSNWNLTGGNFAVTNLGAKLSLIDTGTIGSTAQPALTFGDGDDSNQARIGFNTSSHNFRIGTSTSGTTANVIFTDNTGDVGMIASGTWAFGSATNPSGHRGLFQGSATGTTGPAAISGVTLAVRNTSATNNNLETLAFLNSNATPGAVAGVDGVNINHSASGSQSGALKLWTANAGTKSYALTIDNAGVIGVPLLTASRVLTTDASSNLVTSSISTTTLGYLDATSSIQTQLNLLAPKASPTFTGTIGTPLTASRIVATDGSGNLAATGATLSDVILAADLDLTHNQILALNSTPIQIVAAPGAGNAIMVTGMVASATFVTVAYTAAGSLSLVPSGHTSNTQATVGTGILDASATTTKVGGPVSNVAIYNNTALMVFCGTGNPTGASADTTVSVRVYYRIIPYTIP